MVDITTSHPGICSDEFPQKRDHVYISFRYLRERNILWEMVVVYCDKYFKRVASGRLEIHLSVSS